MPPRRLCNTGCRGVIRETNLTAARLLNLPGVKLVGEKLARFIAAESRDAFDLHCRRVFKTGATQICELQMLPPGGQPFEARLEALVKRTGADRSNHCLMILTDLTERKRAEDALRTSEAGERARGMELETLMDAIPIAVFIAHDATCQKMTGNRAAMKLLRLPKGSNPSASAPDAERPNYQIWSQERRLAPDELPMQRAAATESRCWTWTRR